jgi:hypothetical protein
MSQSDRRLTLIARNLDGTPPRSSIPTGLGLALVVFALAVAVALLTRLDF